MAKFDWDYWRHKYVSGGDEVTLDALANTPNSPSLDTLKRRSSRESWANQRKVFRHQASTIVAQSATAQSAIAQTERLLDAAEIITRHVRLSKSIQDLAAERLKELDPRLLKPSDVIQWVKLSTDIERQAYGLAHNEHSFKVEVSRQVEVLLEPWFEAVDRDTQLTDANKQRFFEIAAGCQKQFDAAMAGDLN